MWTSQLLCNKEKWYTLYVDQVNVSLYLYHVVNRFLLKEFGLKIKYLRDHAKWTQEDLANETGFHRTYIGMIERGERNISITHIAVFARVFELTISQLLDFKEINTKHTYKAYETKAEK